MSKLSNRYFILFGILFTAAFLGSCSNSTGPGNSSNITIPHIGSFFVTDYQNFDSNGIMESSYTRTDTFVQAGLTVLGKTNVVGIMASGAADVSYLHYESNGDISFISDDAGFNAWYTYPFATQGTSQLPAQSVSGIHVTKMATGAGSDSVIIKGQSFLTEKIIITKVQTDSLFGQVSTDTTVDTVRFAPALGWVVQENIPGWRDAILGIMWESHNNILIDYKLY